MKALILLGSYRSQGNTARLAALVHDGLVQAAEQRGEATATETINLGHIKMDPCHGCRVCFDRGEDRCPLHDDMPAVKAKMREADALIVATPVYVDDVSGLTKTWIDRLAHVCHRPEFAGKCAYVLVTTGGTPTAHARRTLTVALRTWGYHLVGERGFVTGGLMPDPELRDRHRSAAQQIGRQMVAAVLDHAALDPSFAALMTFRIQQAGWRLAAPGSLDQQYWEGNGWLNRHCRFFTPIRSHPLKTLAARGVGAALVPFVVRH